MERVLRELKRVSIELIIWSVLFLLFLQAQLIESLSPPVQLMLFRVLGVSMGFIHAHILRKLVFPKIDWESSNQDKMLKGLVIALYVVIIYAYSRGG